MPSQTSPHTELPEFIAPMLAKLSSLPGDDSRWAFEIKWDGMRAIARVMPDALSLLTRNRNDVTGAYPELHGISDALGAHAAILDGEIVAFDSDGHPSFQALQRRMHVRDDSEAARLARQSPVTYMVFDLLWLDARDLTGLPYVERRAELDRLGIDDERWQVPEFMRGNGERLLSITREHHLEGVVAKPLDSRYTPGQRTAWAKIKNSMRQEVVIGGWTAGQGTRQNRIGALHLGVQGSAGLSYIGRVGTGFRSEDLDELRDRLGPLQRSTSPFTGRQPAAGARFVEPQLVCEVEFSEWTHAGTLRQASYKGLREDKPAAEVVRERRSEDPIAAEPERRSDGPTAAEHKVPDHGNAGIEIEDRHLKLTNLDKVLFPACGFTKRDLIDFYMTVAPVLLPHLRDRPLTLKRYPDGVGGEFFYEKRSPRHRPAWVQTVTVASTRGRPEIPFTLCQDLPTLVWLANLADIELHPLLSRAPAVDRPTAVMFDLDPGPPADITQCCAVALELRELFDQLELSALVKTSGSKGLQVYVPLNDPQASYSHTKTFARAVAGLLTERLPDLVVAHMSKAERGGKVLIDWSQNDPHKTTVSVYSLRATEHPGVSTPLSWDEVSRCLSDKQPQSLRFTPTDVRRRITESGDLFSDALDVRQSCPKLET